MESLLTPYHAEKQVTRGPALVLAPHPDDEVLGCAGAIMRHLAAGDSVQVVILTDGVAAQIEHDGDADYAEQRRQESRAAAAVLGYGEPLFWGLPDRGLQYEEALVLRLLACIRELQAAVVYAPALVEMHPDHRALAMAAVEAVRRCGESVMLAMYEIGVPLQPNLLLDITDLARRKQEAVGCFVSQLAIQPYDQHIAALNRYRTYTLPAMVIAAEAYCVASGGELREDPLALFVSEYQRQKKLGLVLDVERLALVSVIVRSIGREVFLQRALDSIALQTYVHIEVIVVNALGTDHPSLAGTVGRFPLRVVDGGRRLGRGEAANQGLDAAAGRYVIFLDDDDWFAPDHIAALVDLLEKNPAAAGAYAGVSCVREAADGWDEVHCYNEPPDPVWLLIENTIPIHAMLFRRIATVGAGACRFDEALDDFEDWDFWLQLQQRGDFLHRDGIGAFYRIHADGGVGVFIDPARLEAGLHKLTEKWRERWTLRQIMDITARARRLNQLLRQSELPNLDDEPAQLAPTQERERELQRQLETVQQALRKTNEHFQILTSSRSWRLTEPLRWLAQQARSCRTTLIGIGWTALRRGAIGIYRSRWGRRLVQQVPLSWKHRLRFLLRGSATAPPQHSLSGQPLVSILIPVFNHTEFLEQCLESALTQTYTNIEVIAVDDASTDPAVRPLLQSFVGREHMTILFNDQNCGISLTQNRALIASRGNIIAFLDCDDYLAPDAVETSLRYWSEETVYSHSGRIVVTPADEEISRISFELLPRQDYFAENLESMYGTHFKMIRRDAFVRVGLYDPRFDAAQDYDILMRIAFHYPSSAFVHPSEFLYYDRFHSAQATNTMNKQQREGAETIQREARLRLDISRGRFDKFLSIIMLSFGKAEQTLEALQSLAATVKIPHEVILFDNGSDEETVAFLKQHIEGILPNVRVFYHDRNLGPAAGRREALAHARGDYFLIFDNDQQAEPGWLEELLVRARSHPDVGAVCCKVVFPNGRVQCSGGYIDYLDEELIDLVLYDRDRDNFDLESAQFRDCDWCPIGATLFTLNPARFLHGGYPNIFEDAGVSMHLRRLGKRLLNSPGSRVRHENIMFRKQYGMKERYLEARYDPAKMLISVATFYRENGLIIKNDYIWQENRLDELDRAALREQLRGVKSEVDEHTGVIG